ncbi:RabGAP/TBC [Xylariaceae sp. FL0255]|nr:RabGAP/TBC [Xylariaceae sp. FL0255]
MTAMAVLQDSPDGSFASLPQSSNGGGGLADILDRERSMKTNRAAQQSQYSDNHYHQSSLPHHPHTTPGHPRVQTSQGTDHHSNNSPTTHQLPSPPISPRWDSLRNQPLSQTNRLPPSPSNPTSPAASSFCESSASTNSRRTTASSNGEARDDFPQLPTTRPPPVPDHSGAVGNFSRPRRPSIKQPAQYDSPSLRSPTQPLPEVPQLDLSTAPTNPATTTWSRSRGPSISSNQSSSTYASLSVRPSYEPPRGRTRQPHPQPPLISRPPLLYERAESSGPAFRRDPVHRMASLPNDELRSSYRSQLSASTAQGTLGTERSSVLTKSSSVTSVYGPVDDGLSVDDVLGLYDKGFDDDSEFEDDDLQEESPPQSAVSETSKGASTVLETTPEDLGLQQPPFVPVAFGPVVGDSPAIFGMSNIEAILVEEGATAAYDDTARSNVVSASDSETKEFRPSPPKRHETFHTLTGDDERDRYGFKKSNQYVTRDQFDQWDQGYSEYLARRKKKWVHHLKENGLMTDAPNRFPARSAKTRRFVRKGIPPDWRGAAWFYYAGGPAVVAKNAGLYDSLLQRKVKDVDAEAIERDLHRTFPDNIRFRSSSGPNVAPPEKAARRNSEQTVTNSPQGQLDETPMISALRRVLSAFSIYNPRIGYCQSLNFLAGLLLLFVESEEHAFWLLNIITTIYLPGTHEMSLEGANVDLGVLMTFIQETMPNVWAKIGGELDGTDAARPKSRRRKQRVELTTRLPPITLCMTAWFMSCFIGTLPIESTLRVWDVFFYEGSKTLFQIALTVFRLGEPEIKKVGDPMEIFQVVQAIPRKMINANGIMEACFKKRAGFGALSQDTVDQRRKERRTLVKAEKDRVTAGAQPLTKIDTEDVKRKGTLFKRKVKDAPRRLNLDD